MLEQEFSDKSKPVFVRAEYCKWLAECYQKLDDNKMSGDWYLEAVKTILSQGIDLKVKAKEALPFCEKALESYRIGGDAIDVLEAAKLKEKLIVLSK